MSRQSGWLLIGDQTRPDVGIADSGAFVIVWESDGSPGTDNVHTSIQARSYTADGIPMSDQYQVNSTEDGYQRMSHVGGNRAARFITVWDHYIDGIEWNVRGRIFGYPTVFWDGFGSGTTSQWSSTTP